MDVKTTFNQLTKYISNPLFRFNVNSKLGFYNSINDETYLKKLYHLNLGKRLNLDDPKTFNEKLQWLKLYDRKPEYTVMVDKFASKKYVADRIGEEYVVPLLGGPWYSFEEIDFDALPNQFVLKTNHDCGGVVLCRDKATFDKKRAKAFLKKHLKNEYFWSCREWPYKNVTPCIFAEEYMKDSDKDYLPVYKIMCFNGEPKIIQTIQNDKQPNESIDYFDTEWNILPFRQNFPNSKNPLGKPERLDEMLELARILANKKNFIRVDFYSINGKIKFSEFTFFSDAGFAGFEPEEWDYTFGSWIHLPKI